MRLSFLVFIILGCARGGTGLVTASASAAESPPPSEPEGEAIEGVGGEGDALAEAAADPLCCCTFQGAATEDFPDVATWVSAESLCRAGTGARMPGQCIDSRWCAGQQPDPHPPRIEASQCCCDVFDGNGESFSVMDAAACAARGDAGCVDTAFCS